MNLRPFKSLGFLLYCPLLNPLLDVASDIFNGNKLNNLGQMLIEMGTLEKNEGEIRNGQSKDKGNIEHMTLNKDNRVMTRKSKNWFSFVPIYNSSCQPI